MLEEANYTVSAAENGKDVLDVMDRANIDLIVLDIMMPLMDGYAFTSLLREQNSEIPILMLTAKQLPTDEDRQREPDGTGRNGRIQSFGTASQLCAAAGRQVGENGAGTGAAV